MDYAETCIRLKYHTAQLYDAMLRRNFEEARRLSLLIATDARLMASHITLQEEQSGTHKTPARPV